METKDGTQTNTTVDASGLRFIRRIGAGGMGEVFEAIRINASADFNKKVAVKRILPKYAADAQMIEKFLSEARLAANLNHPNIVQIYNIHYDRDNNVPPMIEMEFVDGKSIRELLEPERGKGTQRLPRAEAVRIIDQVLAALTYAHNFQDPITKARKRIIHADINPRNIMITQGGDVKVVDFGIGKALLPEEETTTASFFEGTPAYLSPERARGMRPNETSDIFAAGLVFFEMLTGTKLFSSSTKSPPLRPETLTDESLKSAIDSHSLDPEPAQWLFDWLRPSPEQRKVVSAGGIQTTPRAVYTAADRTPGELAQKQPPLGNLVRAFLGRRPAVSTAIGVAALLLAYGAITLIKPVRARLPKVSRAKIEFIIAGKSTLRQPPLTVDELSPIPTAPSRATCLSACDQLQVLSSIVASTGTKEATELWSYKTKRNPEGTYDSKASAALSLSQLVMRFGRAALFRDVLDVLDSCRSVDYCSAIESQLAETHTVLSGVSLDQQLERLIRAVDKAQQNSPRVFQTWLLTSKRYLASPEGELFRKVFSDRTYRAAGFEQSGTSWAMWPSTLPTMNSADCRTLGDFLRGKAWVSDLISEVGEPRSRAPRFELFIFPDGVKPEKIKGLKGFKLTIDDSQSIGAIRANGVCYYLYNGKEVVSGGIWKPRI